MRWYILPKRELKLKNTTNIYQCYATTNLIKRNCLLDFFFLLLLLYCVYINMDLVEIQEGIFKQSESDHTFYLDHSNFISQYLL